MKEILKAILASLFVLCILTTLLNALPVTAKFELRNSNLADSYDEIADSPNTHEMIENAYPYRIFEDRILDVRQFSAGSEHAVGLKACERKHDNFLEYSISVGTFNVDKLKFAGSEWDIVICNNTANLNLYGKPTVPYKKMLIPIGDAEVVNIVLHENLTREISEVKVLPGLMPLPVGFNNLNWSDPYLYLEKNFYADPLIYFSDREFPSEFVQQEVVSSKGNRFLALTVFPFKFYPKDSIVRVFDTRVSIEFTKPVSMIKQLQTRSIFDDNSGYVIIAPSEFSGAVESFSQWKEQLGFSVQITRLEQIYSQFSGRDNVERVRNFIRESYSANGTEYYLLVGDCDVCPVREVWDPANAGMGCDNGTEPSDLYYECLDGDWDANGNSIFGESDDDVDLFPEVKVGRIPVNTTEDVERVLAMIRKCEENPEQGEWIKNFLLIAPWAFTPGDSAAALEEEIYKKFLADSFFNPIRLYDVDGSLSPPAVLSAINQGVGLVDFFDHGAYDMWVGALTTGDVLNLNNGNRTFLAFAMACETAAFDYQEYTTIGEAFFRNQNGGAIGYIGATRIAFAGYDCFDGLHHRFWNYFLKSATEHLEANPKHALQDALVEMVSTYDVGGPSLETIYQAIYFGDPGLNLHWKHNVTTTATQNLETDSNGVVNGTCSLLYSGTAIAGEYRVTVSDPAGTMIAEKTGNLGSQGNYTVNFTTTDIPGNYTIKTSLANPFNYTQISTFTVGMLNVTVKLNSDPIYGVPIQVSGRVLDDGNPISGAANISIVSKDVIVNSEIVTINSSGQYQTEINLTTFGVQALHVWVSDDTKHGGTFVTFKVKRGDILIIADDSGASLPIYPGGWYDYNKGSSTSYYSFYDALMDEYNVGIHRLLYDTVPSLTFLQQYSAVIITCGDHYGNCLTNSFRDLTQVLTRYHNSGGDLIFEGGDVAYSLAVRDYAEFMQSVLHINSTEDMTNEDVYLNIMPHSITQGLPPQILLTGGLGSPSVDSVLPTNGSEMASGYVGYSGGSITAFSGGSGLGSVVYFSFSIDGVDDEAQRNLLIRNSVGYLIYPTLSVNLSDYALLVNTNETIRIHVMDSDTKQPIKNVTVTFDGCGVSIQNKTDSNGECSIFIAPTSAGIINVTVEKTGYPNFTAQIIVYSMPKLTAQTTPDALRKKTQTVSIKVTDFYEHTDVDSVNVTLSGCGIFETDFTNSTGTTEFTITPTSHGHIQLNASKYRHENYTSLVDVCINAVIVDSFGTDYPFYSRWDDLSRVWQQYGTIPLRVDIESLDKYEITYQDLVQSEADVLIISCSAAVGRVYTDDEISAIRRYTFDGHGLIATAGTFSMQTNNNKLAPVFGMREDMSYSSTFMANWSLNILDTQHPLFTNIPSCYPVAMGATACPPDFSWDQDDLLGGTYIAMSPENDGTIIVHNGAVFVSHWVEYFSNDHDFQLMYNTVVWSKYEAPEHDLKATLDAPSYLKPNYTARIRVRVYNVGLSNETDITLTLLVNDTIVDSTMIPELPAWSSNETSYLWTPTREATYNITAYIQPLPSEDNILNNKATIFLEVKRPLINPLEGQWAYYNTTYFDENGEILDVAKTKVTYDRYLAPDLIYVMVEQIGVYNDHSANLTTWAQWMIVNIFDRMVEEGFGAGMWFPYWIETNITLGSEVKIGYGTAIVVDDQIIRINRRPIDCWVLIQEAESQDNATFALWYDKASGLWTCGESHIRFYPLIDVNPDTTITVLTVLNETNIPIGYQHELEVSLETPESFSLDESALINTTIYNFGLVEETHVEFEILINGSIVCSGIIPELGNSSSTTISYLWKPIKKGMYNITAYVHPVPGENLVTNNVESKTVEITGDETPPIVSITSPQDGTIITSTNVIAGWTGFDNETGISYYLVYLDGELLAKVTETSYNLTALTEGFPPHTLILVAYDNAGNFASEEVCFTVDATAPTIEIVFPKDGYITKETNLAIMWMGADAETRIAYYLVYLDDAQLLNTTSPWHELTGLAEGNHSIKIEAYDLAGNTENDEMTIILDTTAPTASVNAPANGSYLKDMVIINITGYDVNLAKIELYISGELKQTWNTSGTKTHNWTTTTYPDGSCNIRLIVYDKAGKITSAEISAIIDNKLPIVEIRNPLQGAYLKDVCDVTVCGYDTNLDSMELCINGSLVKTWVKGSTRVFAWNTTLLPDGANEIRMTVIDKSGNLVFETLNVVIDNNKPSVSITNPTEGTTLTGTTTIEFSAFDEHLTEVFLYIDAAVFNVTGLYSYEWNTTEVGDGTHTIRFVAYDEAGNVGETSLLSLKTMNVQESNEENYLAGRDFGLVIGVISGLAIGLIMGFAMMLASRKKRKLPET